MDGLTTSERIGCLALEIAANGVAVVTFDRPPVNAMSVTVYEDIGHLVDRVVGSSDIRVLVLTAPESARAWCGGADLNDFVGIDAVGRSARYAFINAQLPRLYALDRPVIAAINGHAIGVGMIIAGLCDLRIAANDAYFSCPEIDFGLIAGGAGLFAHLNMPEAKVREMLFTGARFTASEIKGTGFFNYIVPRSEVLPCAIRLADAIAAKSLPVLRARKVASSRLERLDWQEAYLEAQALSSKLTDGLDGAEGVNAFLEGRPPAYRDL